METIEEFFKNKIIVDFNVKHPWDLFNIFDVKRECVYRSIEINPLSLNITNSLDLIEKLKPLFCFALTT